MTTEHSYLVPNNPKSAVGDNATLAHFEKAEWLQVFESNKQVFAQPQKNWKFSAAHRRTYSGTIAITCTIHLLD